MFDDLETAEGKTEGIQEAGDEDKSSLPPYRWAHIPALFVFGVLILALHRNPWGWQIAIGGAYTVYVFWFALSYGLKDTDDLFGDSQAVRYVAKLLIPHVLVLAFIVLGVTEWFHLKSMLPNWATHEGRKGSFWDMFGWLVLICAGIAQGFWMGGLVKRRFAEVDD